MSHTPHQQHPRILIAGCGYTGLRAARAWLRRGLTVTAITRSTTRAHTLRQHGLQTLVADLADNSTLPTLPDPQIVVWSAGYDRNSSSSRRQLWIDGLTKLLHKLPDSPHPRRLILTSTTSVYGDAAGSSVDESTTPQPVQEGGLVCLEAEQLLNQYCLQSGNTPIILRLAGIYGPGRLLRRLQDLHEQRPIPADPDDWLNLIHVDDIVSTLLYIASCTSPPTLMNLAASETATRRTYYQTLAQLAGTPEPVFQPATENTGRGPSGNRRVTSVVRPLLDLTFHYENCRAGLQQALAADSESH